MSQDLSEIARKHVTSIPMALKALATMDRELASPGTYEKLRKIMDGATAIKHLFADVDVVKAEAEDVILHAGACMGEEIEKVPKAGGPGRSKRITAQGKSLGRSATGIPGTTRSRFKALAAHKAKLKSIARQLRADGKDATPTAVVRHITQGSKKQRRVNRERELSAKITAQPDKRYGVIYADPPWRFESYSAETGMDRAADNHYPTMTIDAIAALEVPAADDAVLFLWATAPMLPQALAVLSAWGFIYKSCFVWIKDKAGTGFWNRNKHELLLIGTRGSIPAPAPGEQFESAITAPRGKHSAKPFAFREMIEEMFPTLPRIELFARERIAGWDAWGYEAPADEAA